ncbi:hypothetical protein [Nocardia exalbida]|uniref:hypothetical protein n=1 Tax=Nocardia exalbida TaxID=290231 RepID=UPI0012F6A0D8|nr:hypothetical protein [Nocardia exalbida]
MATEPASRSHSDETASTPDMGPGQPQGNSATGSAAEPDEHAHQDDATTRSARYALIAALCAALISSFVSASAAVYVTVNKADREERLALVQVAQKNRKEAYYDFLRSAFALTAHVGRMAGFLRADNFEGFRSAMGDFSQRMTDSIAAVSVAIMASSDDMIQLLNRFPDTVREMIYQHYVPFTDKYMTSAVPPSATGERDRDREALATAFVEFTNRLGAWLDDFMTQGRADMN